MPKLSFKQKLYPLLALIFLWPALLNGIPFFFPDTNTYIRSADAVIMRVTGHSTEWSGVALGDAAANTPAPAAPSDQTAAPMAPKTAYKSSFYKHVLLGRSIYYGFMVYLGVALHSFLVPVVIQALLVGVAIVGALRHVADPAARPASFGRLVVLAMLVGALTPLPYFVCLLVPDIFAGLLILSATVIATGWHRENAGWRLFWFALLVLGALMHSANLPLLLALALIIPALAWILRNPIPWSAAALSIAAALGGFAGEAAFATAVSHTLGREALRPPFLAIRLIADGPGAAYLRESCPGSGFTYCNYLPQLSRWSDDLMWSPDPRKGIFSVASADEQVSLAHEQTRLVWQILVHHPLWTVQTAADNSIRQFWASGLEDFNTPRGAPGGTTMPQETNQAILASRAEHGGMPIAIYRAYAYPAILLSLAILAGVFFMPGARAWRMPVAILLAGIIVNALVCGTISGPYQRYQDRVMWLPIIAATIVLVTGFASLRQWREAVPTRG